MLINLPPGTPPEIEAKINASLKEIELVQQRELYEENLTEFVKGAWSSIDSSEYQQSWVVEAMCDHLECIVSGDIKRLLINVPPRCSKPVSQDAIVLTERGLIALKEVVVGDRVWTHKGRWRAVTAVHEQGELPVLKILTRTGREVEAAGDHPFLTPDGWINASDLTHQDVLGLVPLHPNKDKCGNGYMPLEEARLLGYLVGDGCCGAAPSITSASDIGAADMMHCATIMGFDPKEYKYKIAGDGKWLRRISIRAGIGHDFSGRRKKGYIGPVRAWIGKHGLDHKSSYTKMIPEGIMRGSNEVVAAFIGAYWSCDGFISVKGTKRDGTERDDLTIGCDSVNKEFVSQMQILLLRLGINSRIRKKVSNIKTKKQGDTYTSWSLTISTQDDTWRFAERIKFYHEKQERLVSSRKRRFDFDRELIGDPIESVEPSGVKPCRCLTVEEDLSFTANGLAVHNTSIVSIMFPVWVWARTEVSYLSGPQVKFLCASFNQGLSLESSTKSRRLIGSPWFQKYWGDKIRFHADQNTKTDYGNTFGGVRKSTSVGSMLLGLGGDILIADDLNKVKNDEIETEDERESVQQFWSEFSSTRLNNPKKSAIIGVQQRLHQSDMSGLILEGDEEYTHLMIPMRHDETRHCVTVKLPQYPDEPPWEDPRKYTGIELMWPERFGETEVRSLETKLGPYMSSGRLQQMPTPKGGAIIRSDWWQLWDKHSAMKYGLEWGPGRGGKPVYDYPEFELVVGSIDTAYGEKEENDYSAMTVWGIWIDKNNNRRAMLVYAWQKRLPLHGRIMSVKPGEAAVQFEERRQSEWGLVELVADTCKRYNVKRLLIEDKSRGRDVAQEINRLYAREQWGCQLVNPVGDKVSRGHSVVPLFTDLMVWAPERRWSQIVIEQCALVPKSDHDDMYDTVTMFLHWAREAGILIRADENEAMLQDEMTYKPRSESVAQTYGV